MPLSRRKGGPNSDNNNNHSNNNNNINNHNNNSNNNHNNKVNSVTELKLGDLVLAKVKGFPAWPAKVSRPEDWERTPDPKKYFVQFFGTQEIAFVAPVDIQAFTSESQSKLLARCKGKTVKYFAQAVKEVLEAFEELQKQREIGRTNKHVSNVNGAKINRSHVETTKVLKSGKSYESNSELECASLLRVAATGDKQTGAMKDSVAHRHENIESRKKTSGFPLSLVQALLAAPSLISPNKEGTILTESKNVFVSRERFESSTTSSSSPYSGDSDVKRNLSHQNAGTKDTSMPLGASVHFQFSAGEDKKSQFSDISKDIKVGAKRKVEAALCHAHDALSGGPFGDGTLSKVSTDGHAKRLASDMNKFEANTQGKASKNLLKCPKLSDVVKSSPQNLVTKPERHVDGGQQRQKNGQAGSEHSLSVKKAKHVDGTSDATKGSVLNNGKINLKAEKLDEEAVPVVAKSRSHAYHAGSNYGKRSLGSSLKNDVPKKRRAVRLCDDEPKTPVHGGSMKSGVVSCSSVSVSDTVKNNENNESSHCARQILKVNLDGGGSEKDNHPSVRSVEDSSLPSKDDSRIEPNVSYSRRSEALDKRAVEESKTDLISPTTSPQVVAAGKKSSAKPNKPVTKVTNSVSHSKDQVVFGKDPAFASVGSNSSQSQVSAQKSRQPSSGVRSRIPSKTGLKLTEPPASLDNHEERDSEFNGRLEDIKDRPGSLVDSKASETGNTMKNLIAQAKRRQAHMQSAPLGGGDSVMAPIANPPQRSQSPSPTSQAMHSSGVNLTQPDVEGVESRGYFASPSVRAPQLGPEESEERRLGLGNQSAGSTLSGGTEAAVARDAFEGMIETLSRTKESIGRATRLAIDCAKYGIANEVVDLLVRKLENESSFHRRVDLFFLVDSITQCSHGQKGVAGASYLPTVQASLPRLLGAAAPPGPNARENQRQCLKVLRLWLERKILPESVLRRFMADIGSSNDDSTSGLSFKRPSKVHRSVDDPIRGMEDMLVDEYGSNATFNLPGFLSTHGFVDDEEDEDDVPSTSHNQSEASPLEPCTNASVEPEPGTVTPNDMRHHILEDVDGELEMEDATGYPKDGAVSPYDFSKKDGQEMQLDIEMDPSTNNIVDSPTLDGSPPPPLESPPPLPPLPSSPPPPPPPPLSPLPTPPPPPPSTVLSQPHLRSLSPSGSPEARNPQSFVPLQPTASPQVVLHPPAANPPVQGGHAAQMTGHISQHGPHFASAGSSISRPLEYRQTDMYPRQPAGPSNQQFQQHQQFQPSQATFVQRPFTPISLPKPPLGPFAYNQPPVQQHLPHTHSHLPTFPHPPSHPYPVSNTEGLRHFSDEQWRPAPVEYKADNHHNTWVNGGQGQSCSNAAFNGQAYVRPPERAAVDNFGHHASAPQSAMGGTSSSGHGINQMLPSRLDTSSLNCWRPA